GSVRLSQLSSQGVRDLRDSLRNAGVSVVTTRMILGSLQQLLADAVDPDLVAINVALGVKVIGRRDEDARKIVPPPKEDVFCCLLRGDNSAMAEILVSALWQPSPP